MSSAEMIAAANEVSGAALVDELVRSGVDHFCVCPGSRSTPLALAIARHPSARLWMHLDERSAAFFGLGLAKRSGQPAALVCTSGTAAANFLPAVVEAFYARLPLVILTADRPHELRDCGAAQTIDQIRLFGSHVKWFFDLEEPDARPELVRHIRTIACRAVATARQGPAGPVHLNCPYREPLFGGAGERVSGGAAERRSGAAGKRERWRNGEKDRAYVEVSAGRREMSSGQLSQIGAALAATQKGLIVCGPQDEPELVKPVVELASALGYPILADALSGVRCGPHERRLVLDAYDAFLREEHFVQRFRPEVVIRFGAMPTSKPVLLYLERHPACRQIIVDADAGWKEPTLLAAEMLHVDGSSFCAGLTSMLRRSDDARLSRESTEWARTWTTADRLARAAINARLSDLDELFEGKVFAELADLLPDGAALFAGNSMPVRDLDTFFPSSERSLRFLANRGANGVDGVVSSALGGAAAASAPLVLVIGDLSFYHDSNGLLAAKQHKLDATIVLLNNDGGGIFSFLPQAADPAHFETLFGTPHGLDFRPLAQAYGATFTRVATWDEFRTAVRRSLGQGGLNVVEVPTERARNVTLHRELWPLVSSALASGLVPVA